MAVYHFALLVLSVAPSVASPPHRLFAPNAVLLRAPHSTALTAQLWSRRAALHLAPALLASGASPAVAENVERLLTNIDRDPSTKRTPADFAPALEVRPIMGSLGATKAAFELNGEGGFDYVWFKNELTSRVIAVKSAASPKPFVLKVTFDQGLIVRPMAYSAAGGLYEGDPFEVSVGDYVPSSKYPGYPKTVGGEALFER